MFFREHGVPHFHAIYGEFNGVFDMTTLEMIEGHLSPAKGATPRSRMGRAVQERTPADVGDTRLQQAAWIGVIINDNSNRLPENPKR